MSEVVFCPLAEARRSHPLLVEKYLGSLVPCEPGAEGHFLYAPPGSVPDAPIQADLSEGGNSRTLIIADEGARLHYLEGCTAPRGRSGPGNTSVVELIVMPGADLRFTTLQDWPDDFVNRPTKRALIQAEGRLTWVDANLGSRRTEKRPVMRLCGAGAYARLLILGVAGPGQELDLGGRLVFESEGCSGGIECLGLAWGGGRLDQRLGIDGRSKEAFIRRRALLLDDSSRVSGTGGTGVTLRPLAEQASLLAGFGLSPDEVHALLAEGFCEPLARELPLEFAVEFTRLLQARLRPA